jgi:hypothetical protein
MSGPLAEVDAEIRGAIPGVKEALNFPAFGMDRSEAARAVLAEALIQAADKAAGSNGDVTRAVQLYERAQRLGRVLDFVPAIKATELAAEKILDDARHSAEEGNLDQAMDALRRATEFNARVTVTPADLRSLALDGLFSRALKLAFDGDSAKAVATLKSIRSAYSDKELADAATAGSWSAICLWGGLYGQASEVVFAGDFAVDAAGKTPSLEFAVAHDARGLARAVAGDTAGALKDFQASAAVVTDIASTDDPAPSQSFAPQFRARRALLLNKWRDDWIRQLLADRNPLSDATVLAEVRQNIPAGTVLGVAASGKSGARAYGDSPMSRPRSSSK